MEIFEFALFTKWEENLYYLATHLAENEKWEFSNPDKELNEGNNSARFPYPILSNYIEYTFQRLNSEKKIIYADDNKVACFNTGLLTHNLEAIFALFTENKSYNKISPFFFKAFVKESDSEFLTYFSTNVPETADYFTRPDKLIFNPKWNVVKDIDHIIRDSKHRFPAPLNTASDREVRRNLVGALDEIVQRVKTNYKLAIPQYYNGKIQLLLPLYLLDENKADLALVVDQINDIKTYKIASCLTTGMAYSNARLIVRPQNEWLVP
jgi:uncharacterized protein DUF3825